MTWVSVNGFLSVNCLFDLCSKTRHKHHKFSVDEALVADEPYLLNLLVLEFTANSELHKTITV